MGRGDKTKLLWTNPEYREHMRLVHLNQPAWNKGVKGFRHSEYTKSIISAKSMGHKAWNKGLTKRTDERVQRGSALGAKIRIGKNTGASNWNWKSGIAPLEKKIRQSLEYKQWRNEVFKRDRFTCVECGLVGGVLRAHHIKLFSVLLQESRDMFSSLALYDAAILYKPLWDVNNGVTYCDECHKKLHKQLHLISRNDGVEK